LILRRGGGKRRRLRRGRRSFERWAGEDARDMRMETE
jgi:hypothetical protein